MKNVMRIVGFVLAFVASFSAHASNAANPATVRTICKSNQDFRFFIAEQQEVQTAFAAHDLEQFRKVLAILYAKDDVLAGSIVNNLGLWNQVLEGGSSCYLQVMLKLGIKAGLAQCLRERSTVDVAVLQIILESEIFNAEELEGITLKNGYTLQQDFDAQAREFAA